MNTQKTMEKKKRKIQKEKNSNLFFSILILIISFAVCLLIVVLLKFFNLIFQGNETFEVAVSNFYKSDYNQDWFQGSVSFINLVMGPVGFKSMIAFQHIKELDGWWAPVAVDGILNWIFLLIVFFHLFIFAYKIIKKLILVFVTIPEVRKAENTNPVKPLIKKQILIVEELPSKSQKKDLYNWIASENLNLQENSLFNYFSNCEEQKISLDRERCEKKAFENESKENLFEKTINISIKLPDDFEVVDEIFDVKNNFVNNNIVLNIKKDETKSENTKKMTTVEKTNYFVKKTEAFSEPVKEFKIADVKNVKTNEKIKNSINIEEKQIIELPPIVKRFYDKTSKSDILEELYDIYPNLTKKEINATFEATFEVISDKVNAGEPVVIKKFGKFELLKKNSREGINPATGEEIVIPENITVKFKAAKVLKDAMTDTKWTGIYTTNIKDRQKALKIVNDEIAKSKIGFEKRRLEKDSLRNIKRQQRIEQNKKSLIKPSKDKVVNKKTLQNEKNL